MQQFMSKKQNQIAFQMVKIMYISKNKTPTYINRDIIVKSRLKAA